MFMEKIKINGIYKHFKGNKYKVINIAKHSETLEEFVVYEALYDNPEGNVWVRPISMFMEIIEIDGKKFSRFELISSEV